MIAGMCDSPAATVPSELEKVLFNVPGSRAKTLQSYYSECSQGMASLNSTNSRVVGPITIPCSYSSDSLTFSTKSCEYSDTDGWIQYASQQAASLFGVDLSLYKHRVLIMPMYYIYDAGCSWMGLGTLGPDATGPNGEYLYSSVWITGEYWRQVMAYMHELGHTNYLHHSSMGSCDYCDYTCPMGGCCDTRCFNPPHNWQLGWGSPIVTLNAVTLPPGLPVTLTLPPQQATKQNMVLIVPDWLSAAQKGTSRPVAWFLGYRTATGAYDDDIPPENQFTTNIYWWDGGAQRVWRLTRLVASVGNGQAWRNTTNQLVVRQLQTRGDGATISICRWNQAVETNCNDGLDNDCDGLTDALDPDCQSPGPVGTSSSILIPSPPSPPRPPFPASPPSPGAPDTPTWPTDLHLAPTSAAPSIPSPPPTTPPSPSLPSPTPPLPSPTPTLPTPPANQPLPPTPIQVINKRPPPLQGTPIETSPSPSPPPPKNTKPPPPLEQAKPPQPSPPTPPTPPPPVPPPSQPPPLPNSSPPPPGPRPLPPSAGTVTSAPSTTPPPPTTPPSPYMSSPTPPLPCPTLPIPTQVTLAWAQTIKQ
ncbi:Gametolysin peptidase M11-domain-containing protein [Haematococcus lacustris]